VSGHAASSPVAMSGPLGGRPPSAAIRDPGGECADAATDADCGEITAGNFHVVDVDVYGLDGDGDGIACET
jgi:hypothetical protein